MVIWDLRRLIACLGLWEFLSIANPNISVPFEFLNLGGRPFAHGISLILSLSPSCQWREIERSHCISSAATACYERRAAMRVCAIV